MVEDISTANQVETFTDPPAASNGHSKESYGGNTWEFDGMTYPKFVANSTGVITIPVKHPTEPTKVIAYIGAEFLWETKVPFIDHLTIDTRDERNMREEETERKRANLIQKSSKLFTELVQGGFLIKINDVGEKSEPIKKTRDEMLRYQPEIQAELIDTWLSEFHVERYFPDGVDDVEALLTEPDGVFFKCRVGDYKNPTSIIIMEFGVPSPDARRAFETDTFAPVTKAEGEKSVTRYYINYQAKIKFAQKYFRNAQGAVLGVPGEFEIDTDTLRGIDTADGETVKQFLKHFCPTWQISLADQLASCFNLAGK